jgi:hypothetical protein
MTGNYKKNGSLLNRKGVHFSKIPNTFETVVKCFYGKNIPGKNH